MLIKILTFNVCVHLHWWFWGGGVDVGGFINRAVAVIELFFLVFLILNYLNKITIAELQLQLCLSELLPL